MRRFKRTEGRRGAYLLLEYKTQNVLPLKTALCWLGLLINVVWRHCRASRDEEGKVTESGLFWISRIIYKSRTWAEFCSGGPPYGYILIQLRMLFLGGKFEVNIGGYARKAFSAIGRETSRFYADLQ